MKLKQMRKLGDFPLKSYQLDLSSAYSRYTSTPYLNLGVHASFFPPRVLRSFEFATLHLVNSLTPSQLPQLASILEPALHRELASSLQMLARTHTFAVTPSSYCHLNHIMLYENLLTAFGRADAPGDYRQIGLFAGHAIKRRWVLKKGALLQSVLRAKRVVRVHCVMDCGTRIEVKRHDGEAAYGQNGQQRIVVFECQNYKWVQLPLIFDKATMLTHQF